MGFFCSALLRTTPPFDVASLPLCLGGTRMANHDECHKNYIECILSREQQNLQAAALHVLRTLDEVCKVYPEPLWFLERQVFRGLWRNMEECTRFMVLHLKPPAEDRDWERNPEEEEEVSVAEGETWDRSKK